MDPEQLAAMIALLQQLAPTERGAVLTQASGGFDALVGLRYTWVADDRVVAEIDVGDQHTQPYGLVHGGVYCTAAEAVCSVGAALTVLAAGRSAVGVENHTRFKRAARPGATLTITATPESVEGPRHTWRAVVVDEAGRTCAEATVVVRALAPGTELAGEAVGFQRELPS